MSLKPSFTFINAKELASLLKTPGHSNRLRLPLSLKRPLDNNVAIVDVRDADYEGGHIAGAIHSPSATFLDGGIETLREQVKDKKTVVFHCALSKVRGPKAARIYAESTDEVRRRGGDAPRPDQEVLVLRGGFSDFQALYKDEKELIEDYDPDIWGSQMNYY